MTQFLHFVIKINCEIYSGNFRLKIYINQKFNKGINNNIQEESFKIQEQHTTT